jgi:hypothetical protein
MIEDVKLDVATFIGTYVAGLTGRIFSAQPDNLRSASPCATIDIVGGLGARGIDMDAGDLLIRIAIISDDVKEIDSLTDDLTDDALHNHSSAFTTIHYGGIHDISPVLPLFVEKEKYRSWKREIDIKGKFVKKR